MQALKEKGNDEFKKGNHQAAYDLYTEAIKNATDSEEDTKGLHLIYSNRAATLLSMERFEEALKDCDRVIQLEPKFMKGYLRKSMALKSLGRKKEALETAKMGLNLEQDKKAVGVPELTKLAHTIQGDLKKSQSIKKRSPKETQELVKEYNEVSQDVEKLNYELSNRQRTYRSLKITTDYLKQVEQETGKMPNTYIPIGRMFISKSSSDVSSLMKTKMEEVEKEYEVLQDKMGIKEEKLKGLSAEVEEILRQQSQLPHPLKQ